MTSRALQAPQSPGGVRHVFHANELNERSINDVLLEIYFRLEKLERSSFGRLVTLNFTTGSDGYVASSQSFSVNSDVSGFDVVRVVNNTSPSTVLYESVTAQDFSVSGGVVTLRWITGLAESTNYTLTLAVL